MSEKKTIFVTIGESPVMHNIIRTDFWPTFLKGLPQNTQVVVLARKNKAKEYSKELAHPKVVVENLKIGKPSIFFRLLEVVARTAINTNTNKWETMRSYHEGDSGLISMVIKRIHQAVFGDIGLYKKLIRQLYLLLKTPPEVLAMFQKYNPVMVVTFSLTRSNFDVPVALCSKKMGILTVGMVRSWDNFTSHGLLRVLPDIFYLQNIYLKEMAERHQAVSLEKTPLEVIGLPHYDRYLDDEIIESREVYCQRRNLDPAKKIILYGAMGDYLFPNEGRMANVFEDLIKSNKLTKPTQVLFRAHPRFTTPLGDMAELKHVIGDRQATYNSSDLHTFEMMNDDMKYLINSLFHSDIVVTGGSTIAVDAASLDKPIICVAFDGDVKNVKHWFSVKRFYDCYTHFEALVDTGGVKLVNNPDELADSINKFYENPQDKGKKREEIRKLFVHPFKGNSGKSLSSRILEDLNKVLN